MKAVKNIMNKSKTQPKGEEDIKVNEVFKGSYRGVNLYQYTNFAQIQEMFCNVVNEVNDYVKGNIKTADYHDLINFIDEERLKTYKNNFKEKRDVNKIKQIEDMFRRLDKGPETLNKNFKDDPRSVTTMEDIKSAMEEYGAGNSIDQSKLFNHIFNNKCSGCHAETYITNPKYFPCIHAMSIVFIKMKCISGDNRDRRLYPILAVDPFLGVDLMSFEEALEFYICGKKIVDEENDYLLKLKRDYS